MTKSGKLIWLRNSLFAVTGALGTAVLAAACAGTPEDGDVEDLMEEAPDVGEQDICGACPLPQTCAYFGHSVCCLGASHPVECTLQPEPDVYGTLPSPGSYNLYSSSLYGHTSCNDSYVIGYQPAVTGGEKWFDHATVQVAPGSVASNPCDCANTELMLEVEDSTCIDGPGVPGACCIGDFCAGSCTTASDCGAGYACVGATPGYTMCFTHEIVRKTQTATWNSTFGCIGIVSIARDDPGGSYYFRGELPQIRATAMDKRTGNERPITVRVYRGN